MSSEREERRTVIGGGVVGGAQVDRDRRERLSEQGKRLVYR